MTRTLPRCLSQKPNKKKEVRHAHIVYAPLHEGMELFMNIYIRNVRTSYSHTIITQQKSSKRIKNKQERKYTISNKSIPFRTITGNTADSYTPIRLPNLPNQLARGLIRQSNTRHIPSTMLINSLTSSMSILDSPV